MQKYEFMSRGWITMAKQEIESLLGGQDLSGIDFTLCEEFTDPPDGLRFGDGATCGFFIRVAGGSVEVGDHPIDDADVKVVSDYEDALAIAHDPDAQAASQQLVEERIAAGRLTIQGDPSRMPPVLAELDVHRLLAARTA